MYPSVGDQHASERHFSHLSHNICSTYLHVDFRVEEETELVTASEKSETLDHLDLLTAVDGVVRFLESWILLCDDSWTRRDRKRGPTVVHGFKTVYRNGEWREWSHDYIRGFGEIDFSVIGILIVYVIEAKCVC